MHRALSMGRCIHDFYDTINESCNQNLIALEYPKEPSK
jgi:hypothetical protein